MTKRKDRIGVRPGEPVPVKMVAVPKEGHLYIRCLTLPRGILVHWGKERPVACPGPEICPTAIHRGRTLWKGYVPAEFWRPEPFRDWAPCVFEVTEHLWELMEGRELRGEVWRVCREIGTEGVKEVCGEMIEEVNAEFLRPAFPIEPVVYRCYRTTHILFDVEPLMPGRIILPPSPGAGPSIADTPKADRPITVQEYVALKERLASQGRMVPGQVQAHPEVIPSEHAQAQPAASGRKFGRVGVTNTGPKSSDSEANGNGERHDH